MNDEVEPTQALCGVVHRASQVVRGVQVAVQQRDAQGRHQRLYMGPGFVIQAGGHDLCPTGMQCPCTPPGDAVFVGQAQYQAFFAVQ